ncbi:MAG: sugar transferase [Patescibacteria group bacterium]
MPLLKKIGLLLGDIAILYVSLVFTLIFRYGSADFASRLPTHIFPFSIIFLVWILIFYITDLYRHKTLRNTSSLFSSIIGAVFAATIVSTIIFYLFGDFFKLTPKTTLLIFSTVFLALDYCWRLLALKFLISNRLEIVVLGNSLLIEQTIKYLEYNPQVGYRVIYWLKNFNDTDINKVVEAVRAGKIQIVVTQPHLSNDLTTQLVRKILPLEVGFINFLDFYEIIFEKVPLEELSEEWFITNITTRRPFYDRTKRLIDFILAIALFVALLPFMILVGILIKLTSTGSVIFKQQRTGKNGNSFTLYKFRIMVAHHNMSPWTVKNDPRLTRIGKILNFTHLNELPQLVNVLKGELSFTGPRPESVELSKKYDKLPYYEMRHIVKPGVTGWAQINFRPSASLEEAHEKFRYDMYYIKNRSLFIDLLIMLKTIRHIFIPSK